MANVNINPLPGDASSRKVRIELSQPLQDELALYAKAYAESYGQEPKESALIPALLEQALAKDTAFKRYKRGIRKRDSTDSEPNRPGTDSEPDHSTY